MILVWTRRGQCQLLGADGRFSEPSLASVKNLPGIFRGGKFAPVSLLVKGRMLLIINRRVVPTPHVIPA